MQFLSRGKNDPTVPLRPFGVMSEFSILFISVLNLVSIYIYYMPFSASFDTVFIYKLLCRLQSILRYLSFVTFSLKKWMYSEQ